MKFLKTYFQYSTFPLLQTSYFHIFKLSYFQIIRFASLIILSYPLLFLSCQKEIKYDIYYVDPEPDLLVYPNDTIDIDLNGDLNNDILLMVSVWSCMINGQTTSCYEKEVTAITKEVSISYGNTNPTHFLDKNDIIDENLTWKNSILLSGMDQYSQNGLWLLNGIGEGYIGVRIIIDNKSYFGWIYLSIRKVIYTSFTILVKDYAFNRAKDSSIRVGQSS